LADLLSNERQVAQEADAAFKEEEEADEVQGEVRQLLSKPFRPYILFSHQRACPFQFAMWCILS
jgi:hypothetical protein